MAFPRIKFSPDTSPFSFLVSTPFHCRLCSVTLVRKQVAQWVRVSAWQSPFCHLSLLSLFCHCSFLFVSSALLLCGPNFPGRWHGVHVSLRVSPALCLLPDVSSHISCCASPHILLCPLLTVVIALFKLGLRGCGVGAWWLHSIHCQTNWDHLGGPCSQCSDS